MATMRDGGIYRLHDDLIIISVEDSDETPPMTYTGQIWPIERLDDEPEIWIELGEDVSAYTDTGWSVVESPDVFSGPDGTRLDLSDLEGDERAQALRLAVEAR